MKPKENISKLEIANKKIIVQDKEKANLIDELIIVKKEKLSRADALALAREKIVSQGKEKANLIDELIIVKKEKLSRVEALELAKEKIVIQGKEKANLIDELSTVKKEKLSRVEALALAKEKIAIQGEEKADLIDELSIVKKEKLSRVEALELAKEKIVIQGEEKAELIDELTIVKKEKLSRVEALAVAKEKIALQNEEKAKRADELEIANKELAFQIEEKGKRADELETANRELEKSLERQKELGILKTRFVSMVSHEFRTPLTSISAASDVILRYYDRLSHADIVLRLEKIKREVIDMTVMLEDVLILGKSDSKKSEYNPSQVNLVALIKDIVSEYQLGEDKNKSISYTLSSSDIQVEVDAKLIKHIVTNLLSNAIKYSDIDTTVEVNIGENKGEVYFSFRDYGIGISKKDIKQLFEPFHRGENVGNIVGTGLGLTVLKKAIDVHKGKLEVESEIGKGTYFKVMLPGIKHNI